ncbi:MAG TPA: hypothetical protein VFN67_36440 [Polyangiales bacterium]|nr:hypothetical protein [Polyangiales bacterium]
MPPEEKTSYDGHWRNKHDPSTPQDPASRITALEAELASARAQLNAQLAALSGTVATNEASNSAVDSSQSSALSTVSALITALSQRIEPAPLPFWRPPGGWDTNFDFDAQVATSPDLSANGWTISLTHSPYTVLTRAGDVRSMDHLWSAAASGQAAGTTPNYPPAAGTYYSTLFGGRLLLQIPGNTDVSIHRATTPVASLYTAGIGGGSARDNGRLLYLSNGAPGAAGVTCAYTGDGGLGTGVTASGGTMGNNIGGYGVHAMHFALEAPAWLAIASPVGRYLRPNQRPLFSNGSGLFVTGSLMDTQHGQNLAALSRVGVRLISGPTTYNTELSAPIELFYIRRQPHRSIAYW